MSLNLPLMRNNITREDLDVVIAYLQQEDPKLTQSSNVRAFEEEWSKWLGVKYSVFVNSGSSANQLTMAALRLRCPQGGEVIVPPLTWSSDIASVLQAGFTPVFVDIDPWHLGMDTRQIIAALNDQTQAVFLTHVQGFNALTDELMKILQERNILLIEDDKDAAAYLIKGLKESGHVTDHASDGEEGLNMALDSNFDVLIVDRMLPKIEGLTLIQELRKEGNPLL